MKINMWQTDNQFLNQSSIDKRAFAKRGNRDVLLTVSTQIDPAAVDDIAGGERPRLDYLELAEAIDADLLDYTAARTHSGLWGRMLERIGGPNVLLGWVAFQRRTRYQVVLTDGEHVGLPFAWLCKWGTLARRNDNVAHLMISHMLSSRKKRWLVEFFDLQHHVDQFLVYSSWQQQFIADQWHLEPKQIVHTPFMVDTDFFSPRKVVAEEQRLIVSAGLEHRDYATLIRAVDGIDVKLVIATGSPFSRRRDITEDIPKPANVTTGRFSYHDLRQLYADSCFIVVPLFDVEFQAGITLILEAMAMGKAVICSAAPGQSDVVVEGETGLYVPPEDTIKLRAAIEYLLANPDVAHRMGTAGRRRVEAEMSLECYKMRFKRFVRRAQRYTASAQR